MNKIIIAKLIMFYSSLYGIDPKLALSVAQIESGLNPNAISSTSDYGVFQLNSNSFPEYSKAQLLDPNINIIVGINYLVKMKKECKFKDNNEWLACYNLGKKKANKIHYPKLWPYVKKINAQINKHGSNELKIISDEGDLKCLKLVIK